MIEVFVYFIAKYTPIVMPFNFCAVFMHYYKMNLTITTHGHCTSGHYARKLYNNNNVFICFIFVYISYRYIIISLNHKDGRLYRIGYYFIDISKNIL